MSTTTQRRARRRWDIQQARKLRRRGVCPCSDHRIEHPGAHLPGCEWACDADAELASLPRCGAAANFWNDPTMPMHCDQPAGHAGAHTDESYNCEWTS